MMFYKQFLERNNKFLAEFRTGRKKYISLGIASILIFLTIIYLGPFDGLEKLGLISKKKSEQNARAEEIRGIEGDLWADVIIGQPDFSEIIPNKVVPNRFYAAYGVIIDRFSTPQKLYVHDGGNNRILGFNWDSCISSTTNPLICIPDIVLGQPNMYTSAINGDSGYQSFPQTAPASASTLGVMQEGVLSVEESIMGASMAVDSEGNLYTTDYSNNRVLKYIRPFETDRVADEVWGQNDFTGKLPNKGMASLDATSLYFSPGYVNAFLAGVEVDTTGNTWVADSGNHRVLRFPRGSKTADLVLGQNGFTTVDIINIDTNRNGIIDEGEKSLFLNRLASPTAVRVNSRGWVYVADEGYSRVMVFKPPFSNGMNGENFGLGFNFPNGIEFDPTEPGRVWIANKLEAVQELWDEDTQTRIKELGVRGNGNFLGNAAGSLGIDSAGNIVVTPGPAYKFDIVIYAKADIDAVITQFPSKQLLGTNHDDGNLISAEELGRQTPGVAVSDNQLFVQSDGRLLFWNNLASLTNGKGADGFAGYPGRNIASFQDRVDGWLQVMKTDKNHRLYAALGQIFVYQLPLSTGEQPQIIGQSTVGGLTTLPVLGGGNISLGPVWGIAPTATSEFLWISDTKNNRVVQVRNPLTDPKVDVILGQTSVSGTLPNRYTGSSTDGNVIRTFATPTTLYHPAALALDRFGNLFVSDHSLEVVGNFRLLVFNNSLFPTNNANIFYAPAASKIFPNIATWEPAFDSSNRMVVGYNANWAGSVGSPQHMFPGVYNDPLGASTAPDAFLKDFHSGAFAATFDDNDNLYVADLNRSRVLVYNGSRGFPSPTIFPTPSPSSSPSETTPGGDTEAPTVSITSPADGVIVSGRVDVSAIASDNSSVSRIELYIDGANVASLNNARSISYRWNTRPKKVSSGAHDIVARALDGAGNSGKAFITVKK